MELHLEAREVAGRTPYGPTRWRWVLTDASGNVIKDHEVRLSPADWRLEAFADLPGYLSWHAAPDRQAEQEARIVAEVGEWIGSQVLGPIADELVRRHPATVRVTIATPEGGTVSAEALALLFRPLELGHVNGKPLSVQDVTLVMQPPGTGPAITRAAGSNTARGPADYALPVTGRLRVLGLFSLPDQSQPLNLRRERHELVKLVTGIHAQGKAAHVRVLQYGVTRDRLRDILEEAEGWDVIHVSGHGAPGELVLETAAGQPDRITTAELATLLDLARPRIKLITIAACWSAASTASEQRSLLGLPVHDQARRPSAAERAPASRPARPSAGALASGLAERLGCAVLAMRYPVTDDFAIALTSKLYELLADKGQSLPLAVGRALRHLAETANGAGSATTASGRAGFPELSFATPALFGGRAVGLTLAAPARTQPESYGTAELKMAGFPPQPDRFVGRTRVMASASEALAMKSGMPGVLLHGMPGGGKTACARELAYAHEHAFDRLVWYKAPDEGMAIEGALTDLALTLEAALPGFQLAHLLVSAETLAPFLPRLTELAESRRLLLVIDNAESLMTEAGNWRDDRWGMVINALTAHAGLGRVVLTSRRVPAGMNGAGVAARLRVESVGALSADEALLLARELPRLKALIYDELPGLDRELSRRLALGVLTVAQGHPKLLELANGQAADPGQLANLVEAGSQAWQAQGGLPDGFFADGKQAANETDYWQVLAAWTKTISDTLTERERDLFWFLCCLEEPDREWTVLATNWNFLQERLGRRGAPVDLRQSVADITASLATVAARGLAAVDGERGGYAVHPGIAAAGRAHAGMPFQDAVDEEAVVFWKAVYEQASGRLGDGTVDTRDLIRAGLAVVPYLMRRQEWADAANMLGAAFARAPSRASAAALLPAIARISRHHPSATAVLASVVQASDPAAAEALLRAHLDDAIASGNYPAAAIDAGQLSALSMNSGRLPEALAFAEHVAEYVRRAGLGPWTQLGAEANRLQILTAMGRPAQTLDDARRFLDQMPALPAIAGRDELITAWGVRETVLDAGRAAATMLRRWEDALGWSAAALASMRDRRAPATVIARTRFCDYSPLLHLGRLDEALAMLRDCRRVFQEIQDTRALGKVLGALAQTESQRGQGDAAIAMERDALRYQFLAGDVPGIPVSYHNLGLYLRRHARQPAPALACHLAAALIYTLTGSGLAADSVHGAAKDILEFGALAVPPRDVPDLSRQIGDIPGTDLPGLIAAFSPSAQTAEQALRDIISQAQELTAAVSEPGATPPTMRTGTSVTGGVAVARSWRSAIHAAMADEPGGPAAGSVG